MKGIIFMINRLDATEKQIYIGASLHTKEQVLKEHKALYKAFLNGKGKYISSFEFIKYADANVDIIETMDIENYKNKEEVQKALSKRKFDIMDFFIRDGEYVINKVTRNLW